MVAGDTAGAAKLVAEKGDRSMAALAPRLAAGLYGLDFLQENVVDFRAQTSPVSCAFRDEHWTTRRDEKDVLVTTFVFNVRNIPAALYKALGGFATNGINLTKLESYRSVQVHRNPVLCRHYKATRMMHQCVALDELRFLLEKVRILGFYRGQPNARDVERHLSRVAPMALGLLAGLLTCALWGLTFVAARLVHPFTLWDITIARYGIFGLACILSMLHPHLRLRGIGVRRAAVA